MKVKRILQAFIFVTLFLTNVAIGSNVPCGYIEDPPGSTIDPGFMYQSGNDNDAIYVYVWNAASEFITDCSLATADDQFDDQAIKQAVMESAERWNQANVGLPFKWGGFVSNRGGLAVCSELVKRPAVWVNIESCGSLSSAPTTCSSSLNGQVKPTFCGIDTRELVLYLRPFHNEIDTLNFCELGSKFSGQLSLNQPGNFNPGLFGYVLSHEFGHVLGLSDLDDTNRYGTQFSNTNSIMRYDSSQSGLFLRERDGICVRTGRPNRASSYSWLQRTNSGPWSLVVSQNLTRQGMTFVSNVGKSASLLFRYAIFIDPIFSTTTTLENGFVGSDGTLDLTSSSNTLPFSTQKLDIPPLFHQPMSEVVNGIRMAIQTKLHRYVSPSSGIFSYDPPYTTLETSNGVSSSFTSTYLRECWTSSLNFPPIGCPNTRYVRTALPVKSAYDNISNEDVYVSVNTNWDSVISNSGYQTDYMSIYLHPGMIETSPYTYETLREGLRLDTANMDAPNSSYSNWSYLAKSSFEPAVACAPNRNTYAYNCLVTWHDVGPPDGAVLYAYFRINDDSTYGKVIEWRKNSSGKIIVGKLLERSIGGVSAAFANNQFHIATIIQSSSTSFVSVFSNGVSYDTWPIFGTYVNRPKAIGTPSFANVQGGTFQEWGVIWNEYFNLE